ncbi:MAG: bifunctional DNA-formamidopyrimidine glycosylase/DNA-(apurinic or apyrimidinic site) lyase [Candidatus Dasytiphilus stammeri]
MPELPEIETICRGIRLYLVGQTIIYSVVYNKYLKVPVSNEISSIQDQKILSVQRRARYIIIELPLGYMIIHLGMSGSLRIFPLNTIPQKNDHIDLIINNRKILRYTDPRRFGMWLWSNNSPSTLDQLKHLGPEPLTDKFSGDYLFTQSRNKRIAVKSWLMDNKFVVGIGNIYSNESLFLAGILPIRKISTLNIQESQFLVKIIKKILREAIMLGGTTLRDFWHIDGKPGYFINKLNVYSRTGKPCKKCGTLIKCIKYKQRSTFFCCKCQS